MLRILAPNLKRSKMTHASQNTQAASKAASLTASHKITFIMLASLLFFAAFALMAGQSQAQTRVTVAEVNGQTIYLDEVMQLTEQLPDEYRRQPLSNYFDQLVDEIIDTRLAAAAAEADSLDEDPIIAEAVAMAMRKVLAEAWLSVKLRDVVNDEAVEAAYERFVADSVSREEVRASHILLEDEDAARNIISELNKGGDFAELAKEFSTGPSGPAGGDLGYFGRGAMVPAFEAAAFDMEVGAYSLDPVQTQFGWHVIQVADRRTSEAPSIEEIGPQIAQNLTRQEIVLQLERLRADASISRRTFDEVREDANASRADQ